MTTGMTKAHPAEHIGGQRPILHAHRPRPTFSRSGGDCGRIWRRDAWSWSKLSPIHAHRHDPPLRQDVSPSPGSCILPYLGGTTASAGVAWQAPGRATDAGRTKFSNMCPTRGIQCPCWYRSHAPAVVPHSHDVPGMDLLIYHKPIKQQHGHSQPLHACVKGGRPAKSAPSYPLRPPTLIP